MQHVSLFHAQFQLHHSRAEARGRSLRSSNRKGGESKSSSDGLHFVVVLLLFFCGKQRMSFEREEEDGAIKICTGSGQKCFKAR